MKFGERRHGPGRRDHDHENAENAVSIRDRALAGVEHKLNRNFWTMIVVFVVLVAAGILDYADRRHQNSLRVESEIRQCQRLQRHRSQDNSDNFYQRQADLALAAISPASRPTLLVAAGHLHYQPRTNCAAAIDNPDHYKPPNAGPFPPNFKPGD